MRFRRPAEGEASTLPVRRPRPTLAIFANGRASAAESEARPADGPAAPDASAAAGKRRRGPDPVAVKARRATRERFESGEPPTLLKRENSPSRRRVGRDGRAPR